MKHPTGDSRQVWGDGSHDSPISGGTDDWTQDEAASPCYMQRPITARWHSAPKLPEPARVCSETHLNAPLQRPGTSGPLMCCQALLAVASVTSDGAEAVVLEFGAAHKASSTA